jgi:hypothetical protein
MSDECLRSSELEDGAAGFVRGPSVVPRVLEFCAVGDRIRTVQAPEHLLQ